MCTVSVDLEDSLVALLREANPDVTVAAREFMVLELYRRGALSSGKAAEHLGVSRLDFIRRASNLGIPFFDLSDEEWEEEKRRVSELCQGKK